MVFASLHPAVMLAFFQATQLNLFERFLTQAMSGIDSTGITAGMQNVAYVVLLVGFLWQVYQSALHGGDVRGLGHEPHQVHRHSGRRNELRDGVYDDQSGIRKRWQLDKQRIRWQCLRKLGERLSRHNSHRTARSNCGV